MGTAHAYEAVRRGLDVEQFEASAEARQASVRSLGALTFSAASPGLDLTLSLEAARLWTEMLGDEQASGAGPARRHILRRTGSFTVAVDAAERSALQRLAARADAPARGWQLLDREATRSAVPALDGELRGSLHSDLDAVMDPTAALSRLRRTMEATGRYRFRPGVEIRDVESDGVVDYAGRVTKGDFVVLCPGASFRLAASVLRQPSALRSVRLQAVQTSAPAVRLTAPLSDLTSLLAHGVEGHEQDRPPPFPDEGDIQVRLNCVPRPDGSLLVGQVQDVEDPHGFDLLERPMNEVLRRLENMLGAPLPPVTRRWSGTVHESLDGRLWYRSDLDQSAVVIAGTDERGITLAPAIACDTFDWMLEGIDSGASHAGAKHC
jgi:hypothetical protein